MLTTLFFGLEEQAEVDQPQSSAPPVEAEPREDPLGEESREIHEESHPQNVVEKNAGDGDQQGSQTEEEATKDEGAVESSQIVQDVAAPKKEDETQEVPEAEASASATQTAPVQDSGVDKPDGETGEKPTEQSSEVGEIEGQKGQEKTDEETPVAEAENAEETQPAAEEAQTTTADTDEEIKPAEETAKVEDQQEQTEQPSEETRQEEETQQPSEETKQEEETRQPSEEAQQEQETQNPSEEAKPEQETQNTSEEAKPEQETQNTNEEAKPEQETQASEDSWKSFVCSAFFRVETSKQNPFIFKRFTDMFFWLLVHSLALRVTIIS